jgi:hypothetical protein
VEVVELKKAITEILAMPVENLIRRADWGALSFEGARLELELTLQIFRHYDQLALANAPKQIVTNIVSTVNPVIESVREIDNFSLTKSTNTTEDINQITNRLRDRVMNLYMTGQSVIPFLAYLAGDVQKSIEKMTAATTTIESMLKDMNTSITGRMGEADRIVSAMRDASGRAGVAQFTHDFSNEANTLGKDSRKWLTAAISLVALTFVTAISMYLIGIIFPIHADQQVSYTITKVVVLAILVSATVWSGNIYRALRHQVTVNRHRANSLMTFQAFVAAAEGDAEIKNAVLLETTRSIFASTPTGYIPAAGDHGDNPTKIFEMLKGGGNRAQ